MFAGKDWKDFQSCFNCKRVLYRPWTYPFFEDIISYPLSRPKKWYNNNILSYITAKNRKRIYILYPFQFYLASKTRNSYYQYLFWKYPIYNFPWEKWTVNRTWIGNKFFANIYWQFLPTTSVNKNSIAQ
jgi:hypothetical protein